MFTVGAFELPEDTLHRNLQVKLQQVAEYEVEFVPKVRIDVIVDDAADVRRRTTNRAIGAGQARRSIRVGSTERSSTRREVRWAVRAASTVVGQRSSGW